MSRQLPLQAILFLVSLFLYTIPVRSQISFWSDSFDTANPSSGDRDASNHADGDNGTGPGTCGAGNYFYRISAGNYAANGVSLIISGFSGSYWRGEDLDACIANPDVIDFTGIDISGLSNFRFTGSFAASSSSVWEASDQILVQYSIDGGSFMTGLAFESLASSSSILGEDTDQDGVGDGTTLNTTLNSFSFTFDGTGSTLALKLIANVEGGSEEFAFDNFQLEHSVVLPVELISFQGKQIGEKIQLFWKTASEINNDKFEVQHSGNGIDFNTIAEIKGANSSLTEQDYFYMHETPIKGVNYYRLKQSDFDGTFEYSDVLSVDITKLGNLKIFPNPVSQKKYFTLYLPRTNFKKAHLQLFNSNGQLVYSELVLEEKKDIQVFNLSKGIYWGVLDIDGTRFFEKIIIL